MRYLVRWPNVISAAVASGSKCHPPAGGVGDDGGELQQPPPADNDSGWAVPAAAAAGGRWRTEPFRTSLPVPGATFVT